MKRKPTAVTLGDVIPTALRAMKMGGRPTREKVEEVWQRIAGKEAAQHSWPKRLSQGRLVVEVESSGWMYTLSLRKPELLAGWVEWLGISQVKELTFRIGEKKGA